jgi:cbb3-type cytochrome c oxidase subunit III
MRTKIPTLAFGAACTIALLAACGKNEKGTGGTPNAQASAADTSQRTFAGDPKLAIHGREVFIKVNCYGCHGGLAGGAMGPSLRDTTWKYGGTDSLIWHSIHDGRPMGMPTWAGHLSNQDIDALVMYIRSLRTSAEPKFFFASTRDSTAAPAASGAPSNP